MNDKPTKWTDVLAGVGLFLFIVTMIACTIMGSCRDGQRLDLLREEHKALMQKMQETR